MGGLEPAIVQATLSEGFHQAKSKNFILSDIERGGFTESS